MKERYLAGFTSRFWTWVVVFIVLLALLWILVKAIYENPSTGELMLLMEGIGYSYL